MLGLEMLDLAIGMTFIFLMLSLICTALNEIIEAWWKKRAVELEKGIRELLHDPEGKGLANELYKHPLVFGLFRGDYDPKRIKKNKYASRSKLPSYIPSRNFALALMDIVLPVSKTPIDKAGQPRPLQSLRSAVQEMKNENVQKALLALIDDAGDDIDRAKENIEAWYDSSMDRVAGWYKRRAQLIVLILGFLVAIGINADTIAIFKSLANDKPLRNSLVVATQEYVKSQESNNVDSLSPQDRIKENMDALAVLGLPIGWDWKSCASPNAPRNFRAVPPWGFDWLSKIIGWGLTAIAISLGAPFWFDVLNKFMVIRSTVKPHEKSPEESSEDRQSSRDKGNKQAEAVLSGLSNVLRERNFDRDNKKVDGFMSFIKEKEEVQEKIIAKAIDENTLKWENTLLNFLYAKPGKKKVGLEGAQNSLNCIDFVVEKIEPKESLHPRDQIPQYVPTEYEGKLYEVPTNVIEGKVPDAQNDDQYKPKDLYDRKPGNGISRKRSEGYGTFGLKVYKGGQAYVLSCYHVLCNIELETNRCFVKDKEWYLKEGEEIDNPKVVCPCWKDDPITNNFNYIGDVVLGRLNSYMDAAIVKIKDGIPIGAKINEREIDGSNDIYDVAEGWNDKDLIVKMWGRTSGYKEGKIKYNYYKSDLKAKEVRIPLKYKVQGKVCVIRMANLIELSPLSKKGDSGAPVFTEEGKVIGIIVGGNEKSSYVISIRSIISSLRISTQPHN